MGKRSILNVRQLLETAIMVQDKLLPLCNLSTTPPILLEHISEQASYARAILAKHAHTRKDVRFS